MKKWMIFKLEAIGAYYLYDGVCPTLIHLTEGLNPDIYYWMGDPNARAIPKKEQASLDKTNAAHSKAFTLRERKYVVKARGAFYD